MNDPAEALGPELLLQALAPFGVTSISFEHEGSDHFDPQSGSFVRESHGRSYLVAGIRCTTKQAEKLASLALLAERFDVEDWEPILRQLAAGSLLAEDA